MLPEPARSIFLNNAPGTAYDATSPSGKFVVVSSDDGLCSCIAQRAPGAHVAPELEAALQAAGIGYRAVADRADKAAPALHHREYVAAKDNRAWRILAAATDDPAGGHAMLTAGPAR
jgi:hypothetical protein